MSDVNQSNVKLDKDGIPMVMTTKEYLGDACGAASTNCLSQMAGQLTYFYTDKVGMSAASASMVQMVAILCDGISDIIMGRLVDKTNTKEGKCRPWLKWMIIPLFFAILLLTTVPKASPMIQNIYATLSLIFCRAVVYTGIIIPYFTMMNFMTKSMEERGKIGNYRQVFNNAVGVIFGILIIPVTNALGGTQKAWIMFAAVTSIIACILLNICYKCTKERYREDAVGAKKTEDSEVSVLQSLNILIHNKYWVLMLIAQFALYVVYIFQGATLPYYCMYIQGSDNLAAFVNTIAISGMVASFLIAPVLIKRIGLRNTGLVGGIFGVIGTVIRMIAPYNMMIFAAGFSIVLFGIGTIQTVLTPMIINTCEYNDYKYGYKLAGITNSAASFGGKVGAAIGQVLLGAILASGGYNAMAAEQSASALRAICVCSIDIIGLFIIAIMICFAFYTFDKKYPEMFKANRERRAAKGGNK